MNTLTKAEEKIMQYLWKLEKAFIKEIIEEMDEPKPPYNSVSTIVRVLVKKEFVAYNQFGNTYQYYPLISKEQYTKEFMGSFMKNYFGGSFKKMVHFFSKQENVDLEDVNEIMKLLEEVKDEKKK